MKKIFSGVSFAFFVLMAGLVSATVPTPLELAKAAAVTAVKAAEGSGDIDAMVAELAQLLSQFPSKDQAQVLAMALNAVTAQGPTRVAIIVAINQLASDLDLTAEGLIAAGAEPVSVLPSIFRRSDLPDRPGGGGGGPGGGGPPTSVSPS